MPRSKEENFKRGDKVQAKWSGTSIYYPATMKEIDSKHCKVQFEDGSMHSIKLSDVKALASKPETPGRTKSNRIRSRSRSGGRKLRSRSRTPPRKTKALKQGKSSEKKVNSISSEKITTDVDNLKREVMRQSPTKTPSPNLSKNSSISSTVVYSEAVQHTASMLNTSSSTQLRSSARIAALQTARVAARTPELPLDRKTLLRPAHSKSKYSDDDEASDDEEEEVDIMTVEKSFSYLSCISVALKIILLMMIPIAFSLACHKRLCNLQDVLKLNINLKELFHSLMIPLSACLSFHLTLSIMSKIPIGREISGFPFGTKGVIRKYRLNGIYVLILSALTFCGLAYYKIDMNWGFDKIRPIVISSVIYSLLWSLVLHLRAFFRGVDSDQAKSNKDSGFLGNFYYGHEINPVLYFDEDVKTRFIQFGLIGLALVDMSVVTKVLLKSSLKIVLDDIVAYGSPLLMSVGFQLFVIIDYFWREETMLSTALYTNDGVGYGFLASIGSLIPSMFAIQVVFLASQGYIKAIHLPHYCSALIFLLFCFGYYLYASSGNLKYNFRRNAYSASVANIASIPTSKKKRLIISGLWGIIRHPNYLGLIIMAIASSLPCGFSHILLHAPAFAIITILILRSFKVETICKEKYGPAWGNYTEKVKSRLIPHVF